MHSIDEQEHDGDLHERPHDSRESLVWLHAKHGNTNGDGKFEITRGGREGQGDRMTPHKAEAIGKKERAKKHNDNIKNQRNTNSKDAQRQSHNRFATKRKHDNKSEEESNQGERGGIRNEFRFIPISSKESRKKHPGTKTKK